MIQPTVSDRETPAIGSLVFIGGIYGSGKTTACHALSTLLRGCHLKASDLARHEARGTAEAGKAVDDVGSNQRRLLANLSEHRKRTHLIILDGHFCLYNRDLQIEEVPVYVFSQMRPSLLLLLEIEPAIALARLIVRERAHFDADRLSQLASREKAHAVATSAALGIPLEIVHSDLPIGEIANRISRHVRT